MVFIALTGYLISLFGSLVYNEIIILNCWKLDENTRMKINKRSKFELLNEIFELREDE